VLQPPVHLGGLPWAYSSLSVSFFSGDPEAAHSKALDAVLGGSKTGECTSPRSCWLCFGSCSRGCFWPLHWKNRVLTLVQLVIHQEPAIFAAKLLTT